MLGDDDFNIWDDMDEDVKRIFFDSDPLYTDEDALFEDEEEDDFGGVLYDEYDDSLDDEDD